MEKKKAKLFNIKHFAMDLGRVLCFTMPLFFHVKKIYTSKEAKAKIRGGAIIVSNHISFFDPLLIGSAFWYRRMFFLTAKEVMEKKGLGFLLKLVGCITIDRDICDMTAVKRAIGILKEGHTLTIFPQGGIKAEDDMNAIKGGVILMTMQAKVPIVPIYIYKKTKRGERNTVVIGESFDPFEKKQGPVPTMADIQSASQMVLEKMLECKNLFEKGDK